MTKLPVATAANDPPTRMASWALVFIGTLLAAATMWNFLDCFVDDAYISLRYARNLLEGNGLIFNPGEYVEGVTNLGHVLAVASLGAVGVDLSLAARLLGALGAVLAVVFGPAALLPEAGQHPERSIARLLLLANFSFMFMAVTGLETILYTGIACVACYTFERGDRRIEWSTGLLLGALFSLRPDGSLIALVLLGLSAARWGPRRLLAFSGVWIWLAAVCAIEVFRFSYFGAWVPNTALVKGIGFSTLPWYGTIGDDLVEMLAQTGGASSLLFALVALIFHQRREALQLAVPIGAAALFFETYAGGDWMLGYRFLLPALPFYFCLVSIGMMECLRALIRLRPERARLLVVTGGIALVVIAVNCWSLGLEFLQRADRYPYSYMTSKHMSEAGRWLAGRYPEETQLQATSIGALAFFSRLTIIDTLGLTDRTIARIGSDPERKEKYLRERNPELIVLLGQSNEPPSRSREIHGRRYELVRSFPLGDSYWWLFGRVGQDGSRAGQDGGRVDLDRL